MQSFSNRKYCICVLSLLIPTGTLMIFFMHLTTLSKLKFPSERHLTAENQKVISHHYFKLSRDKGRLGNWIFQCVSAYGIAKTLRYQPCIDPSHPLRDYFEIDPISCQFEITNLLTFDEMECRNESWNHNSDYLSYNLTVSGYLQSWKYFDKYSEEVRKLFAFKSVYINKGRKFLDSVRKSSGDTVVGIHVRRGDFTERVYFEMGYTVADKNYIDKAMSYFGDKISHPLFVVVSDDLSWCKDNIKGPDVWYSSFTDAVADLALLSLCDHVIITGGSFGWWGGWLSGGMVVYLKDFPRPGSLLEQLTYNTKEHYYPPNWIGISN